MSKTPSKKLYNLIHALSGSEKRYFKLFINKKGIEKNNKYVLLFDAIDAQETFDEEELQGIVYDKQPIASRKYSELKSYLYELVLKSLQSYDEKTSYEYRLKSMLQNVRVLYKRGHYDDCKEILQKAKKMALKYESFTTVLDILNWEKQIAHTLIDISFFEKELHRIETEEQNCLQYIQDITAYRNRFFKLYALLKKIASIGRNQTQIQLSQLMDTPLLSPSNIPTQHHAKIWYYRIYSLYEYATGNAEGFYEKNLQLLEIMESKPYFLKQDVSEYISAISNHVVSCVRTKRYVEWESTLNKYLKISTITYDDELKVHRQYYQGKFAWCIRTGAFEQAQEELEKHFDIIKKYDSDLFTRSSFYYQYFQIYFALADYDNALEYLNKWLDQPKTLERQDLQNLARILNLIIHYEMGNTLLLESLLRSTYRYLKKVNQLRPIEQLILSFIRNSTKIFGKKEMQAYYISLQEELDNISESGKVGPFDFRAWLTSKISEKPYAQILRAQFLASQKQTE